MVNNETSILHELKNSFQNDFQNKTGLLEILEKHHTYLKDCIAVLLDSDVAHEDKQTYLYQFLHILHMHARAEEETLYQQLIECDVKEARLEGVVGQDEHNIVYQLASEIRDMNFNQVWSEEVEAKSKVLAIIVQTHLEEEENDMFPLVARALGDTQLDELANDYLNKCEDYLHYEMLTPSQYSAYSYSPRL